VREEDSLRAMRKPKSDQAIEDRMEQPPKKSAFKILVVEDNLLDFELMETALVSELACDVHLVVTKGQFEDELAGKPPDLIVSDSNMAGFDGLAALTLAGERCPDVAWVSKENGFTGLVAFVKKTLDSKKK
jgi:PleD family two-component response regulator